MHESKNGQISLLLGSGFSKNKGYPTAKELNKKIVALKTTDFFIRSDGSLCFLKLEEK